MKCPYGLSNFGTLIGEGSWYQDRTDRLALSEALSGDERVLIPQLARRFGVEDELAALPAVAAELDEDAAQAADDGATLRERHGLKDQRAFAVVALGVERLVWRAL